MNQHKGWSFAGIFVILLVLSMPVYSANALAAIQITRNTGEAGIPGYIDAGGDVWNVDALITGVDENLNPEDVKLVAGSNKWDFQSCSEDSPQGKVCTYSVQLLGGVTPNAYDFKVEYGSFPSAGSVINADGSPPQVNLVRGNVKQEGDKVGLAFSVRDPSENGEPCVGIAKVEIINADTSQIVETVTEDFSERKCDYAFKGLVGGFEGEGTLHVKVRSEDRLGHSRTSSAVPFLADFVAPVVKASSLNFAGMGRFIGEKIVRADIEFQVIEHTTLKSVVGYSEQVDLDGVTADCIPSQEEEGVWNCKWSNVPVSPQESISIRVVATDGVENVHETTLSKSFNKDSSPPKIDFFGTDRVFAGNSYVSNGGNKVILRVSETGAGMDKSGIEANLGSLGSGGEPTFCNQTTSTFDCYWDTSGNSLSGEVRILLSKLQDNVGNSNQNEARERVLKVDNLPPVVEEAEVFGISEIEKEYFQSGDTLKIKLKIKEEAGVRVKVDVRNVMNNADVLYKEGMFNDAGWAIIDDSVCTREEGLWVCELTTEPIKQGYLSNAFINVEVEDTAGNTATVWPDQVSNVNVGAEVGKLSFEILAVEEESEPNYWEVGNVKSIIDFVDIDAALQTHVRVPVKVPFVSDSGADIVKVDLLRCVSEDEEKSSPEITRSLLYGAVTNSPTMVMEFAPFDGKKMFSVSEEDLFEKAEVEYKCSFRIYSKIGNKAARSPELEEVTVKIPFAFSELGSKDENVDAVIDEIKEEVWYKIPDKLRLFNEIIKWVRYLSSIVEILDGMRIIWGSITAESDEIRPLPVYGFAIAGLVCEGSQAGVKTAFDTVIEVLQTVTQVFSCNPSPYSGTWYGTWQQWILDGYNVWKGGYLPAAERKGETAYQNFQRGIVLKNANTLYDNIWVSSLGLCIPGIIHNLEKYRQTRCTEMKCLKEQVPAGTSTVEGCKRIGDYLACKNFYGEFIGSLMPLASLFEAMKNLFKNLLTNPLGLIRTGITVGCSVNCAYSGKATEFCDFAGNGILIIDMIDNIIGLVQQYPSISYDVCEEFQDDIF